MNEQDDQPIDADALLAGIADLRTIFEAALTDEELATLPQPPAEDHGAPAVYTAGEEAEAVDDFTMDSAIESLALLTMQMQSIADRKREALYRDLLQLYYAMEKASREPGNEHLIEHVEGMRKAHLHDYGRGIPPEV